MILAHFSAVRALRKIVPDAKIGIVNNFAEVYSMNFEPEDMAACERRVAMYLTLLDPMIKAEYPPELVSYKNSAPYFTEKRK
jgi:beta-glucosidase/6-phospho-beta-glucosidase/beta-galactosidase